ncbi:MAG TPA: fimbria/pilus periplasmic chaperone [Rhizomicrobium sp.]
MRRRLPDGLRSAATAAFMALTAATAQAQTAGLTIYPVTIDLAPGQKAAALTIQNHTDTDTTFQIRAFSWVQANGSEQLLPTDTLMVSPPLGTIAAGTSQVVRLVLREPARDREATYRILFDEILAQPRPGTVNFALRLSIPVFALPPTRVSPHLQWSIEHSYLVAVNNGGSHETVRDISLSTPAGRMLQLERNASPYVLAGAIRRWQILTPNFSPGSATLRLKANADNGAINQPLILPNVQP